MFHKLQTLTLEFNMTGAIQNFLIINLENLFIDISQF